MDDPCVEMTRRILVDQALTLLRQGLEQMGPLPTTDRHATLAAIANIAHRLSLNQVIRDARNEGHEFYPDQMHIIMDRIPVEQIVQTYLAGDRSEDLVLKYVKRALGEK